MRRVLFIILLLSLTQLLSSQSDKDYVNGYFLKYWLYPVKFVEFFIDSQMQNGIKSVIINENDTITRELRFVKNKLSSIIIDSTRITFTNRFGKVSKIQYFKTNFNNGKTKFVRKGKVLNTTCLWASHLFVSRIFK